MPPPPIPGWNEPVATGRRSPILSDDFCPSSARIGGFWISLVSVSPITADRLEEGIVTWKSVAFRLPSVFRFSPPDDPVGGVVVPVVVGVVVLLMLLCRVTVALVGGLNPKVRDLSLLTCNTAMATHTSLRAVS